MIRKSHFLNVNVWGRIVHLNNVFVLIRGTLRRLVAELFDEIVKFFRVSLDQGRLA